MTDADVLSADPGDMWKRDTDQRTVVEIDAAAGTVRINGTNVGLIAEDGIKVEPGSRTDLLTVTLVLYPHEVRISSLLSE